MRTASAVLAVAATLFVAGCGSDGGSDASVDVPDVTNLILQTAQQNIERLGLTAEVVDSSGDAVVADDPATYVVVEQDPADGTVDAGTAVTLTVESRD
jgi:beta-lactam-binding protein with PASTA domain